MTSGNVPSKAFSQLTVQNNISIVETFKRNDMFFQQRNQFQQGDQIRIDAFSHQKSELDHLMLRFTDLENF